MIRITLGLALICAGAASALADCSSEVVAAFEKQRTHAPGYHVAAEQTHPQGTAKISVDYVLPDRMQQKIVAPGETAPIETIAVAKWAWGNMGGGWEELQPQFAQTVTAHVQETLGQPTTNAGQFECLGKVTIDGKEYLGYRSVLGPAAQAAPEDKGPGALPTGAVARTIYVDPATGLPAINTVGETKPDAKPFSKSVFTYPEQMQVEAPVGAAPAPRTR